MSSNFLTSWLPVSKSSARRPRVARLGIEYLEERLAPAAVLPPDIVVGRTLSTYTVAGVQNHTLDVTYTVYNQTADDVTGVLLTTALQPGVTFVTASALPDRSGPNLAWSLGTIHGFDRASVTLTVTLPAAPPLQIDSGAHAFATLNAGMVTDDAPAAALVNRVIPADLLASTPDANTADPFVQEQAARLDYDPQRIFDYLNTDVGYESYVGSLRGARGTLWSAAGNSLDEASLGVALMRASGIPARYAHGTLSDPPAKQLILSMFPANFQTIGYIPAGTPVADPANDPQLLSETRGHYWLQIDSTGGGFVNADTSGLPGSDIGTAFTATSDTFTEVADGLRHKTEVKLTAETYELGAALFGIGDGLSEKVVLDQMFNDVDLVGRPLTIGNLVSSAGVNVLGFATTTVEYSPYLDLSDYADPRGSGQIFHGMEYQEILSNLPFSSRVLTGLFLQFTLSAPAKTPTILNRTLLDRIGYDSRAGLSHVQVSVSDGTPAITELDLTTVNVLGSQQDRGPLVAVNRTLDELDVIRSSLSQSLTGVNSHSPEADQNLIQQARDTSRQYWITMQRLQTGSFAFLSDTLSSRQASASGVTAYFDGPRVLVASTSTQVDQVTQGVALQANMDLLGDSIRAVASPGQATTATFPFQATRGYLESFLEGEIASVFQGQAALSTPRIFRAAENQSIPLATITSVNVTDLQSLQISSEAKARITDAVGRGDIVIVPSRSVLVNGVPVSGWYQYEPDTGALVGVLENGMHGTIEKAVSDLSAYIKEKQSEFDQGVIIGWCVGAFTKAAIVIAVVNYDATFIKDLTRRAAGLAAGAEAAGAALAISSIIEKAKVEVIYKSLSFGVRGLGVLAGFASVTIYADALLKEVVGFDPPLGGGLFIRLARVSVAPENSGSSSIVAAAQRSAGTVSAAVSEPGVAVSGAIRVSWHTTDTASVFSANSLNVATGTVRDASGVVGGGTIGISGAGLVPVEVTGTADLAISGNGSLGLYTPAESSLGVSTEWDDYTANVTGNVSITLTVPAGLLKLNGLVLPAGTYTIATSAASLSGSGRMASPSFAGSVAILATDGTVSLGAGSGNVSVVGSSLDVTNGATFTGYTGYITIAAGGGNNPDDVTLDGTAADVLTVSTTPGAFAMDQNTPTSFHINVNTSLVGTYTLTAEAPSGWAVSIDDSGSVSVMVAPGSQGGTFPIRIVAKSNANRDLVAQVTVKATVTPTVAGLTLTVHPDTVYTVPTTGGAQSPTAFRASIQNLGSFVDTFTLSATNLPAGFDFLYSGTSINVPAGETGILGLYLRPNGATLPPPGTPVSFTITATSTTNPAITQTRTVTFTMPAVHGVTFTASPDGFGTVPGGSVTSTLTLTAVGNVSETVSLSAVLSSGLTSSGLTPTVTLTPGQTRTIPVTLTAATAAPLNSYLAATITAQFNPLGDVFDQRVVVPVRVMVPGADAVAAAAVTAARLSDPALSNRLTDLAAALTNLVQAPDSGIYRSQALASLDALLGLIAPDPFVTGTVPALTAARTALAAAVTGADVRAATLQLGTALTAYNTALTNELNHRFVLTLDPNTGVVLPNGPATFNIAIQNTGAQVTTYDLFVSGIPGGMLGTLSRTSVTLQPGETLFGGPTGVTVTVTSNGTQGTNNPVPSEFYVSATAHGFSAVTLQARGAVAARRVYVGVPAVTPAPGFTDPGPAVAVSAKVLNVVNAPLPVLVSFTATAPGGAVVFTSTPTAVTLDPQTTLTTVALGTLPTAGLALGQYTLDVTVTDVAGTLLTGGTGRGFLLVGTPVSGSLTVSPTAPVPGQQAVVTNAVTVQARTSFPAPVTLLGAVATSAPAISPAVLGTRAYVATANVIEIVDLTDPANPVVVGSFGAGTVTPGGWNYTKVVNGMLVVGSHVFYNANHQDLLIYDLTDPLHPVLRSNTRIPYPYSWGAMYAQGNTLYLPLTSITFVTFSGDVGSQNGDVLAIDITDPAAPRIADVLFDDAPQLLPGGGKAGSVHNVDAVVGVTPQLAYAATSTSTGGTPAAGVGRVQVINTADPSNLSVVKSLDIPGTVHAVGIGVHGNRALVVGTTGGWNNPTSTSVYGYSGRIVLSVLDVTDPANPLLLASLETSNKPGTGPDYGRTDVLDLGGGRFAVGNTTLNGQPVVMVVDISDPLHMIVGSAAAPSAVLGMELSGGKLYAAGTTGLTVYSVGQLAGEPVTVSVRIPKVNTVLLSAASFNEVPTQTVTGPAFDTLVWTRSLGFGTTSFTFTWNTIVLSLEPNEPRAVTAGATIDFIDAGTSGSIDLPPTSVTANRILAVSPPAQTVAPGGRANYTLTLTNPSATALDYGLTVQGVPAGWVTLPASVRVPAGGQQTVTLTLAPTTVTAPADYEFAVAATGNNGRDTTRAVLTVAGTPVNAPDSEARGVVAQLTPATATAGRGTAAGYTLRVTNTGSATDTFDLTVAGLPAGVTAAFEAASVTVPPGAGNFREVRLTLTTAPGSAPGALPFTVTAVAAAHPGAVGTAPGTLTVVAAGVGVTFDRATAAPGETLTATVTNTGTAADTFDLAAAGPAGLVAALGVASVTLAAGESRAVSVTTGATPFAVPGPLGLTVTATSRAASAVRAAASADLLVAPSVGLAARFDPSARTLAAPGTTDFLLLVDNTGNTEDAYTATVVGTTGGLAAVLIGLDGLPTAAVPVFRLPGLSSGAILVRVTAEAAGTGTVAVRVASIADPTRAAVATATLAVGSPTAPAAPAAAPQAVVTDADTPVAVTLAGTDPNAPPLPLTFSVVAGPAHGTLGAIAGGAVSYTPTPGYVGPDVFTFVANNGAASSAPATVSVQVRAPRPVLLGYHEFGVGAGAGHPAVARFFNPDGSERFARNVFPGLTGGVRVTSADFTGDGVADLVAGTGPGSVTRVVVLDGTTGDVLFSLQPFEDRFTGGVFVAAGDITGDGIPDLVISPDESGGPRVRVFTGAGFGSVADFFGIDDENFRGGARAAVGDVNGDGFGDLVVSAGFGGGPRISVTDGRSLALGVPARLFNDFFLFEEALRNGAYVAAGDLDGDGLADVIGGGGPGGGPRVFALSGRDLLAGSAAGAGVVANFFGGDTNNRGGIRVVARDLDGDRRADLVVGDGAGAGSRVTGYLGKDIGRDGTPVERFSLDAYSGFAGGVFVG